jgi:hypothetical protein
MARHRMLALLAAAPLAASLLTGCSQSSPTEPSPLALDDKAAAAPSSLADASRGRGGGGGGNDDGTADDNRGRRGGRGNEGADDDRRRGRRGRGGRDDRPGQPNPTPTPSPNPTPNATPTPPRAGQQFEGSVTAVSGNTIRLANGTRVVVSGATQWDGRGDLFTLDAVARSAASGDPTRVEGRGTRQADGAILASTIKAEVDN